MFSEEIVLSSANQDFSPHVFIVDLGGSNFPTNSQKPNVSSVHQPMDSFQRNELR
jgi:hypothetical protein